MNNQQRTYQMMLMECLFYFFFIFSIFIVFLFLFFFIKSICCRYPFDFHPQVSAIQMGTINICLYKEVDKKYTGCNLKTRELFDCALIRACAVIRLNTVCVM